ncbi:MAG: trigger factor [Lachnospiraceae bacterium]|nr:trigger factor [Lachnospiraceae bacterium]MDE7360250.1 trigger factor [Lachnospiraceae bacterium]
MKRKTFVAAAVFASSLFLTACGSKEYLKDIKAEKYVTLGTYTGIEARVNKPEVPEGAVDKYIYDNYLGPRAEKVPVTDRAVQEGDVANIDFVGYHDGVAFDGGTGTGFDLTIGSGRFIEGFEEGLIGADIGETRSLDLTFPDPYTNPDLAGEDVVFEVTVNSISESRAPELTDALVKQLGEDGYNIGGAQTVQELNDWVYNLYDQSVQSTYDNEIETAMASTIMENSTFQEPPEEMIKRFTTSIENNMNARAASLGMTLAQYMQLYQGMDETAYRAAFEEEGVRMTKQYIMYQAIADQEGLAPTEEELSGEISALMTIYGYASEEELKKSVDVESLREDLMRKKVLAFLKENGNIQETATIVD